MVPSYILPIFFCGTLVSKVGPPLKNLSINCVEREGFLIGLLRVKKVLLDQPSSAAAERVFSLLSASFHEEQENALSDYLQASAMLQYNNRR